MFGLTGTSRLAERGLLALLCVLAVLIVNVYGAEKAEPKRSNEIVTCYGNYHGDLSGGSATVWKYDGKGGYKPVFRQDGMLRGGTSAAIGDADNDGRNEILIFEEGSHKIPAKMHVYRRGNDGVYQESEYAKLFRHIWGGSIDDVDGDGKNEVLSISNMAGLTVNEYRDGQFRQRPRPAWSYVSNVS